MALTMQEQIELLTPLFEPVVKDIQEIKENTEQTKLNTEKTTEHLEQVQESVESPPETEQPVQATQTLTATEEVPETSSETESGTVEEEQGPDTLELLLEQTEQNHEVLTLINDNLIVLQEQQQLAMQADHMTNIYGLFVLPAAIVIFALWRLINPFLR